MSEIRTARLGDVASAGVPALWTALKKRGWSQGDLATAIGTTSSLVNRWAHGDRKPGRKFAEAIRRELGIDPQVWDEPMPERFELRPTGTEG